MAGAFPGNSSLECSQGMPLWKRRQHHRQEEGAGRKRRRCPPLYDELWNAWSQHHQPSDDNEDEFRRGDADTTPEPRVDWDRVALAVQARSSGTKLCSYQDAERDDMLLLHFVVALAPPVHVVDLVLDAHPPAWWHRSTVGGLTPLMVACGRNASPAVIQRLASIPPTPPLRNLLAERDHQGFAAVHWACRENVSHQVLRQLLRIQPDQSTWCVGHYHHQQQQQQQQQQSSLSSNLMPGPGGISPLEILYQKRTSALEARHHPEATSYGNQWKKLCYLVWARHYGSVNARSDHVYSTLHAVLACSCPTPVIEDALAPSSLTVAGVYDFRGNLPLHYAVRCRTVTAGQVRQLLQDFPAGARCLDASGRLPLHQALRHGKQWHDDAVEALYQSHPAAGAVRDRETGLWPFLLAALHADLDATYTLLRDFPQAAVGGTSK